MTSRTGCVRTEGRSPRSWGDRLREADETLQVRLTAPTAATPGDPTATGTLRDDD